MNVHFAVTGLKTEWLRTSSFSESPLEEHSLHRCFSLLGGLEPLGKWGLLDSLLLSTVDGISYQASFRHSEPLDDVMELRLLITDRSSLGVVFPIAIECGSTLPRHATVIKNEENIYVSLNFNSYMDVKFAILRSEFPGIHLTQGSSEYPRGPLLTLHFYGNNPRFAYNRDQWSAACSPVSNSSCSSNNTSSLEVCALKRVLTLGASWTKGLRTPCSGKLWKAPSSSSRSPTNVKKFPSLSSNTDDFWCTKALQWCPPITDEGLHQTRTQEYWIAAVSTEYMDNHVLEVTIRVPCFDNPAATNESMIGKTIITPSMLGQDTNGLIDVPVQCHRVSLENEQFWVMLHIQWTLQYPLTHPRNNLRLLRSKQSFDTTTTRKPVGHRGLGRTFTRRDGSTSKCIRFSENSIEAFTVAHRRGCEMVEFDVMLTEDGIPIAFHDPVVEVLATATPSSVPVNSEALNFVPISVPVHNLSESQLRWVLKQSANLGETSSCKLKRLMIRYWSNIVALGKQGSSSSDSLVSGRHSSLPLSSLMQRRVDINHPVPTLKEIFLRTPSSLRLNIEVKYPFQPMWDNNLFMQKDVFEINRFVDAILQVVFTFAEDERYIALSSFDPDVCVALVTKQSRFDVLFLSDTAEKEDLKDYRTYFAEGAIQFAFSHKLSGISIRSCTLRETVPEKTYGKQVVDAAHRRGLKVWTWGEGNDDAEFVTQQIKALGVDGVITDTVRIEPFQE